MTDKAKYKPLIVHSAVYKTEYTKKYESRIKWEKPDENKILSFIPGTIIQILAKEGQKLKEGDTMLILEAMKMHNKVQMPFNGKIVKIHVTNGEKIPKSHLMVEIEKL